MEMQFVNPNGVDTLEHYAISLVTSLLSLKTIEASQIAAMQKGILDESELHNAETMIWELRRLMKIYQNQSEYVLARLPDDFNLETIMDSLRGQTLAKAKQMTRKRKPKKDEKDAI